MTVGDKFTSHVWFAQCKLEQTGYPINAATARPRHAVKCVCHTAHTAIECRPDVFIPGIAMSAAHADPTRMEDFDRFKCAGQFGRDRYTLQYVRVFEQLLHSNRRRVLNELDALRSGFRFRNKWPFDMNTDNRTNR